jgi:hypothetical protein
MKHPTFGTFGTNGSAITWPLDQGKRPKRIVKG